MSEISEQQVARHIRNLARNQAAAKATKNVTQAKRRSDRFVLVSLRWAELMTRATNTPSAFVGIWLLHLAWKAKTNTVVLPNVQLEAFGISRKVKMRAIRDLERAGLIRVERCVRKAPRITLLDV